MLLRIISSIVLATSVLAQNLVIGYPAAGSNFQVGKPLTIRIDKVGSPQAFDASISIGIASCGTSGCLAPTTNMGTLLYNGAFNPVARNAKTPPSQTFALQIPANFPTGPAQLNLVDNVIVGASKTSYIQSVTLPLNAV
ncbi:hypothetical protein F5887DRAFT_482800 [Amanita rubescens]|nr:hypothetical protein F5887DRAFT_482800 [Amanita rubescens]